MFWNKARPKNHPMGAKKGQKPLNQRLPQPCYIDQYVQTGRRYTLAVDYVEVHFSIVNSHFRIFNSEFSNSKFSNSKFMNSEFSNSEFSNFKFLNSECSNFKFSNSEFSNS